MMGSRNLSNLPKAICILNDKEIIMGNEQGKISLQKIATTNPNGN